jgi:plasmid stability protein
MVHHLKMSDDAGFTQFKLRLPNELKAMLELAATRSGRSVSAEMINRLHRSFADVDSLMIRNRMTELKEAQRAIHLARQRVATIRSAVESAPESEIAAALLKEVRVNDEHLARLTSLQAKLRADIEELTADLGIDDTNFRDEQA